MGVSIGGGGLQLRCGVGGFGEGGLEPGPDLGEAFLECFPIFVS